MSKFMINSIKINGKDIKNFAVVTTDLDRFAYPMKSLTRYLKKYAGITPKPSKEGADGLILIGDDNCSQFESSISMDGNVLKLAATTQFSAENVVDRFIAEYLSKEGDIDIQIPNDGTILFKTLVPDWNVVPEKISLQDQMVRACLKIEHLREYDDARGLPFTYQHLKTCNKSIDRARFINNRTTNCVIAMNWVLKDTGLWHLGILNHVYDGTTGYAFEGVETEKAVLENFDILVINKPLREVKEELLPGDMIFFQDHNQVIVDTERALDGGRGNTDEIAVGSRFHHFVRENLYWGSTCGFIFRAKDAVKN